MRINKTLKNRIRRWKSFHNNTSPGQIMVIVTPWTFPLEDEVLGIESRPLNSWNFPEELDQFVEHRVKRLKKFLNYTHELDNDYIPTLAPSLGIALHSAFFTGKDFEFGEDTSWTVNYMESWEELKKLKPGNNNRWARMLLYMAERVNSLCTGDYVPGTFGHFSTLDMANAVRGNRLFYDFYDYPEKVHELLSRCADAVIWLEQELEKISKPVMGGRVVGEIWNPGNALFLSEDVADLCSPEIFNEFARKYDQKIIDTIGGAFIHHHGIGAHVHQTIAQLRGIKTFQISLDPNVPPPSNRLNELFDWNGSVPLMIECTAEEVKERIEEMTGGRLVLQLRVESLDEAHETIRLIRSYSGN